MDEKKKQCLEVGIQIGMFSPNIPPLILPLALAFHDSHTSALPATGVTLIFSVGQWFFNITRISLINITWKILTPPTLNESETGGDV